MTVLNFIKSVAWGGCSVKQSVSVSIAGHGHKDHIVKDTRITVYCPENVDCRKNVVVFEDFHKISRNVMLLTITPMHLKSLGIQRTRLHTTPILVEYRKKRVHEYALYIDDIDVEDVPTIKELIEILLKQFGREFKAVLLPVYNNGKNHGASDHKELAEKSRELIEFAVGKGLTVFALAHPVIPQWCKNLPVIPVPKILETMDS